MLGELGSSLEPLSVIVTVHVAVLFPSSVVHVISEEPAVTPNTLHAKPFGVKVTFELFADHVTFLLVAASGDIVAVKVDVVSLFIDKVCVFNDTFVTLTVVSPPPLPFPIVTLTVTSFEPIVDNVIIEVELSTNPVTGTLCAVE